VPRHGKAFDLVVEGEESLSGQVEAVVCLQLAFGDVDEDAFLEIEQFENGQGVSLAVDGAQVVARKCELASRRQYKVVLTGFWGSRVAVKLALGIGKPTLT
jgi:hypothetical protein